MCSQNPIKDKSPLEKKADLYYSQGTSYLIKKRYTEALSHLLEADKLRPNDSKIKNNLAMAYYFKGQTLKAINILEESIELEPNNSDAKNNLASIYFQTEQYEKSKNIYTEVLKDLVYKHQYRTHFNLALIALKQNREVVAQKHLYQSLKVKNDYCPSLFQLGAIEEEKGNLLEALKHFKESTKSICYNDPRPHYEVAKTLLKLKKTSEAEIKLLSIIRSFPKSSYSTLAKEQLKKIGHSEENVENLTQKINDDILDLRKRPGNKTLFTTPDF